MPQQLSAKDRETFLKRFGERTISAYWQIGVMLARMSSEAQYGDEFLQSISHQIDDAIGPSLLQQCRRLATHWSKRDVKAAERAGLSLRSVIALLALDSWARRLPTEQASALKAAREKLVQQYRAHKPSTPRLKEDTRRLKLKCAGGPALSSHRKLLSDGRRVVSAALETAQKRVLHDCPDAGGSAGRLLFLAKHLQRLSKDMFRAYTDAIEAGTRK